MVFDARGETLARSDGAAPLSAEVLEATGAEVRERARAGARRGYAPSGELHGRSLAVPVVRTPARGNGEAPEDPTPEVLRLCIALHTALVRTGIRER